MLSFCLFYCWHFEFETSHYRCGQRIHWAHPVRLAVIEILVNIFFDLMNDLIQPLKCSDLPILQLIYFEISR